GFTTVRERLIDAVGRGLIESWSIDQDTSFASIYRLTDAGRTSTMRDATRTLPPMKLKDYLPDRQFDCLTVILTLRTASTSEISGAVEEKLVGSESTSRSIERLNNKGLVRRQGRKHP